MTRVIDLAVAVTSRGKQMARAMLLAGALFPLVAAQIAAQAQEGGHGTPASPSGAAPSSLSQPGSIPAGSIPGSALPGAGAELMGRVVEQVQVTAAGEWPGVLLKKLPLKAGDRLERDKLRESLHVLYATGLFSSLEAYAKLLPSGGVAVEFRTTPEYFNGNVTATGMPKSGPSETEVVVTGRLELGTEFNEAKLRDSENRILHLMQESGYWQAQVSAELNRHEDTQQVDVQFKVTPGVQARVGKFVVTGDPTLTPAEAVKLGHMTPGRRVRRDLLQHAVDHLRTRYAKQKRLRAQLTPAAPLYHVDTNVVDFSIAVERGPVVEISVAGFKLSRGKLKQYVPVWEEHAVDEDLLNEGRRNLRDYLESLGYFDATVKVQQQESNDLQHIVFTIDPKQRYRLRAIGIEGNKRFDTDTIRDRMTTQPSSLLLPHGRYSQSTISNDLKAIEALYQANGYPSVKATSQVIGNYQGKRGDMKLVVKIDEGSLVRVGRLEIEGTHAVSQQELRGLINTRERQPFSEATVDNDREVVLTYYFNRGFQSVKLDISAKKEAGAPELMDVVMKIQEGPQEFVNKVLVSGVVHTKPRIVNKAIVIEPRQELSQEKMFQSQRNLYDLGIFTEVNTAIQNPEGEETYKNVLFQIQEARRWTIDYGFGIEAGSGLNTAQGGSPMGNTGVSPRGTLNITRLNFRGRDESISFKSHVGLLEKLVSLTFDQPHWFDLPNWHLSATGLYDNSRDVNTFTSSREEGSLQLAQRLTKATQLFYRFSYRRVVVDPTSFPAGFTPDLIPLYSKPVRVGMPSMTYLRDTRDNAVNSTRGNYATVDIGAADSIFGSEADFGRLLAQHASYYRLRHGWVFARSLRIGFESPFGSLNFIPLPERFFVGGSNSHRGFAINQAGPRDPNSGFPLGGSAMIVNNVELRTPPVPLPKLGNNVSFVIFDDLGNDFDTSSDMWHNLLRFSQRNPQNCIYPASLTATCDFNYLSDAVGGGIRYRTPIGPVRFDLGYNLNPPLFPINAPCAGVTGTCTAVPHTEQLHHFNFFFSIGQTF